MTYPGTKPRERTALESSLTQDVLRLERERDELLEALRELVRLNEDLQTFSYVDWCGNDSVREGWQANYEPAMGAALRQLAKYRSSAGS